MIQIKEGGTYIATKSINTCKLHIIELTAKSVYIHNLDSNAKYRLLLSDFNDKYLIIEEL